MSFFKTSITSSGQLRITIGALQLTPSECISLLQAVLIKKDAINSEKVYNNILNQSKRVLTETGGENVRNIVQPLYGKVLGLFRLLISMEDASPLPNVDWAQVDACLIDIDANTKELFKKYSTTIWAFSYLLVPFFQGFISDPRTKKVIAEVLTKHSLQPVIGQMIANECHDCGVTVVPMPPVNSGFLSQQEVNTDLLEAVLEKISVIERIAMERSADDSPHYIRDLAYLQALSTDDFYYQNGQAYQRCRLTALTQEQLIALMSTVMRPCEDNVASQRATLQTLAILLELYRRLTGTNLGEKDLASILLALQQSQFELQWQLDANKTSPGALLLYTSLLCLRGDVVHIEDAERLLALQNAASQSLKFLAELNIVYTECTDPSGTKIGVLHTRVPLKNPHSYYFGSQFLKFSEHPALNLYLAQTLLEMKQSVIQAFDAWYAILRNADEPSLFLQNNREGLLKNLDCSWMQFISTRLSCQNLQQIDHLIQEFQRDNLVKVWQKTEKTLSEYAAKQTLSSAASIRLDVLRTSSDAWTAQLSQQHFGRYAASLSDLSGYDEGGKYLSQARLHYDRAHLLEQKDMDWLQRYLKQRLLAIQRLCPAAKRTSVAKEQFEILIHYLGDKCGQEGLSPEWVAAMDLCVNLYHCMESILVWSDVSTVQENMGSLSKVTSDMAIQALAKTLMKRIHWVTQTDSFYYRWLESRTVKRAAHHIYDLAQKIAIEPSNKDVLKSFMQALFEQQSILSQLWWYFPFGQFFGYADLRDVRRMALQQVNQMVSLQQISVDLWQEAQEAAQSAPHMQRFDLAIFRIRVDASQSGAWQTVLQEVQAIQVNHSGFAMLYELQAYLQTQRHKFILSRPGFFYGTIQIDQIAPLLKILDRACCEIEKTTQGSITYQAFLAKKAQQVLVRNTSISSIYIQIGRLNDYFFDMRTQFKGGDVRCKRFYQANDLFTFARKAGVLEEAELGVSVVSMQI